MQSKVPKYKVIGQGHPILLVQGGPGFTSKSWGDFPNHLLSLGFQCIIFDHFEPEIKDKNDDENLSEKYSLDLLIHEIEHVQSSLGYEKLDIFAHSFGAYVALNYVRKHPERFGKIILCSPAPLDIKYIAEMTEEVSQRLEYLGDKRVKIEDRINNNDLEVFKSNVKNSFKAQIFNASKANTFANLVFHESTDVRTFMNLYKQVFGQYLEQIKSIDIRMELNPLIIHGKDDPLPVTSSIDIKERLGGSHVKLIEECGHFPAIEQPVHLSIILKKYLLEIRNQRA